MVDTSYDSKRQAGMSSAGLVRVEDTTTDNTTPITYNSIHKSNMQKLTVELDNREVSPTL